MSAIYVEKKNRLQRPNDCTYWVSTLFLAGEYPGAGTSTATQQKLGRYLDKCGIRTFVDLTQNGEKPSYIELLQEEATKRNCSIHYHRLPIPDFGVPSSHDTMKKILDTIDASIANGDGVYVHCRGGIGRTGMTVGCWLVRNTHRTGEEALMETNRLFRTYSARSRESAFSPETQEQMDFVRPWKEDSQIL
ncbi:dual specificity phosphatase [Nitzschia inconspicua]|uniref:Dual specificity phosphatase n=1 Tax=Nitzschia inconspicua TaxID=303405 RepID=A0A9K3PK87_9STRA|nr:dual specificity phosphatase [Nitzschia inconspicua]